MQDKSIIEITDEVRHLMFQRGNFIAMNQPVPEELTERIMSLLRGQEIDKCVSFIKMGESHMKWLDDEIEHLEAQKSKFKNAIRDLKDLAKFVMEENGITKMEGERGHSFSLRRNESVEIKHLDKLPSHLLRQKISIEADKPAIKEAIKSGEKIEGAEIVENYSVVIK